MEVDNKEISELDKKINNLIDLMDRVEPYKLTILTGSNGSGKSLIRKQLCFHLAEKLDREPNRLVADVSMQRRTEANTSLGALCSAMHDLSWVPTSVSTYNLISGIFKSVLTDKENKRYIVIDEPEIGMSKETQLAIAQYLRSRLDEVLEKSYGLMIITHSECIVNALKDRCDFLNTDKECTADEWVNREIIPIDLEKLDKDSSDLFIAIRDRSNKKN